MNLSAVPSKCVELSALPIKDARIRRLFIVADGKRSLTEIFRLCMIAKEDGIGLIQSLLDEKYLRITEVEPDIEVPTYLHEEQSDAHQKKVETSAFVKGLTEELSKYVGPFAAMAMGAFHIPGEEIGYEERRRIINKVVAEIDGEDNRLRFLTAIQLAGLQ